MQLGLDPKAVAGGVVRETRAFIAEHGTQSGDVDVQPMPGDVRGLVRPELLDEALCPYGLIGADQQAGEQAALAQRTETFVTSAAVTPSGNQPLKLTTCM